MSMLNSAREDLEQLQELTSFPHEPIESLDEYIAEIQRRLERALQYDALSRAVYDAYRARLYDSRLIERNARVKLAGDFYSMLAYFLLQKTVRLEKALLTQLNCLPSRPFIFTKELGE